MARISNVRVTTKFYRSIKAISPVIATLLMIAIAVVASLVVYAWVTGYIGRKTSTVGNAIQIQSFASLNGKLVVYVQNVGQGVVELKAGDSLYVNGDLVTITNLTGQITVAEGQTVELQTNIPYAGEKVTLKVTTTGGTFTQITGKGSTGGASLPQYTLTVDPSAQGHVTKSPDQAQYTSGTSVMINAVVDTDGYTFQSWSGDVPALDANSNPVAVMMDGNKVVTPNFVLSPETLTMATSGTGVGTIDRNVNPPYSYGAVVRLTAVPDDSSTFGGWSGAGTTDGGNPLVRIVTLTSDQTVTATFTMKTFTITPSAGAHGSITPNTAQTVNYGVDSPAFAITAGSGYHIVDVVADGSTSLGGAGLTTFQYTFSNVQASHTITASFAADAPQTVAITITSSTAGAGFVTVDSTAYTTPHTFDWTPGTSHTIAAISPVTAGTTQYVYTGWSDTGAQSHSYTVPSSTSTVTANYKTQYQFTVNSAAGTPSGQSSGWYDAGTSITSSVSSTLHADGPPIVDYTSTGHTGTGSATSSGTQTITFTLNAASTVIWNWHGLMTLYPTGDDSNGITSVSGASTHFAAVSDYQANDGTAYVYVSSSSGTYTDYYVTQDHGTVTGTINSVTAYIRGERSSGTSTCTEYTYLKLGTSTFTGAGLSLSGSYQTDSDTVPRPGGGTWSWTDINNMEIGASLYRGSSSTVIITLAWAVVDFNA